MLFIQVNDLHVHVHLDVVDSLHPPLHFETSFIDRFLNEILEGSASSSLSISFRRNYFRTQAPLDLLAALKNGTDANPVTEGRQTAIGRC